LGIKNQKEYNALSREVKLGKKVVGEIEDAILGFMTETEGLKRGLEKKESDYQGLESDLLAKKAEAETISNQAKEALVDLNSQKEKIAESIEREFLKKYQMVKKVRGTGIAELDNGTCTGCHMAIPPQLNIRVLKQEEFIICPNCNRILYVRPENIPIYNKLES
jgi:predicted  nucleic acid-binding Zn-ribbon protein